ncbi:hypothetical protein [Arenibacterium sp. LLYu02]|uniref:hypothetical protein n=1 Tax=Arenibacterium sp. LLYu02 TaxID=3404132 RepID=UPI003B20E0D8
MPKGLDKIEGDLKKLLPKMKPLTKVEGLKLVKAISSALDTCWDLEEKLVAAITAAREAGNAGTSVSELDKDRGFKAARVLWDKAVAVQKTELAALAKMVVEAKTLLKDLAKLTTLAEKEAKAAAKGSADLKAAEALIKRLAELTKEMTSVTKCEGKLKPAEKFYAMQAKKILDKRIQDAGKGATSEADLPKLLEDAEIKRNALKIKRLYGEVQTACKKGSTLAAKDAKGAASQLKVATQKVKDLQKLVEDYQKARKKCEKDIKEAKNSKELTKQLDGFDKHLKLAQEALEELSNTVEKASA